MSRPEQMQPWTSEPLRAEDLRIDVGAALRIAGERAGDDMLSVLGPHTQVSLFLARGEHGVIWEVRYDAWRDGKPLRDLVVRVDARTGSVVDVSG